MSKPQTPVKPVFYFDLGGKTRPVRFDYRAQREAAADFGVEKFDQMEKLGEIVGFDELPMLLYRGLQGGARKEGALFDASQKDVSEWLDDYDGRILGGEDGLLGQVLVAFLDAFPKQEATANGQAEGVEGKASKSKAKR